MSTSDNSNAFDAFRKADEYIKWKNEQSDVADEMVKVCEKCGLVKRYKNSFMIVPLVRKHPDVCMDCSNEEFLELVKDIH